MSLAQLGCPEASENFLRALQAERPTPEPKFCLEVNWRKLLKKRPAERIITLRDSGYNNDQIAGLLGYKDARSVRSQIVRYRRECEA